MNHRWVWSLISISLLLILVTACAEQPAPVAQPTPPPAATKAPVVVAPTQPPQPSVQATAAVKATSAPQVTAAVLPTGAAQPTKAAVQPTGAAQPTKAAVAPTVVKAGLTCPPPTPLAANAQLAARVNGQGIPLDLYNRQVTQAQAAFVAQGIDTKSAAFQDMLKSLRQQVLDQMINDVVITQQADKEGIKVVDNDVNARLAQMIQDAGSVDKLNEYLSKNQLSLADFCTQIRSNIVGEAMLNNVTKALPTSAEQVHIRQILVTSSATAQQIKKQLDGGADFQALAKQYSADEASKANGGDLGWSPKGRFEPLFETAAFQLTKPGQISDVIQTQFGYHIIQLVEREASRPLPPELIQNARQQAFLVWLQAIRQGMKIESLVQP